MLDCWSVSNHAPSQAKIAHQVLDFSPKKNSETPLTSAVFQVQVVPTTKDLTQDLPFEIIQSITHFKHSQRNPGVGVWIIAVSKIHIHP